MSFLMQPQRGYQHVPQQNLSDINSAQNSSSTRMQIPNNSYQDFDDQPQHFHSSPSQHPNAHLSFLDHANTILPKVGETRCYWSLLSSDLHFIYLDPVLASHLAEQADALVGKSLLTFVHPDEQTSAKHDLGSVLKSRTLHGSVTRVRFSRLSKVRRDLGFQGTTASWIDAEKIALDSNYMAVDIVINWAAEGLVLCFIHAVVDLTPDDNDELNKTGWTNWCGTVGMGIEQVQLLYRRLLVCIPQSGSMSRVFQILSNQQGRPLLMTWPPDNELGQGPTGRDFAKLVEDVQIGARGHNGNDAKTSCTRRYKALQNMSAVVGEVESVFIPHGTVIFACHKFDPPPRPSADASSSIQQLNYAQNTFVPHASHQQYYDQSSSYALPPSASYSNYMPQYSPQHWSQGGGESSSSHQQYHSWNSPSPAHSTSPLPPAVSNLRSGSYPSPQQGQHWASQPSPYLEPSSAGPQGSPTFSYSAVETNESAPPPAHVNDAVPPPRRRVSPGTTRDQYGPGGRSTGNRPVGVLKCSSCKATQSPEWRKGPSGKKELCNACGLRYARSRAKKEGHTLTSQRRRKDKGAAAAKRESATPPVSAASSFRQGGYDNSFSTGSNSGSEVYSQSSHHGLDTLTPSPSPPASAVNFVHYSPHSQNPGDGRQTYNNNTSSFYSVPSPLSNAPVINSQQHLEHVSATYSDRLSPVAHSPLTSTTAPASFEREREKDRELPPTPVSAEPRQQTRKSTLTRERR